jgi:hypothetical protein
VNTRTFSLILGVGFLIAAAAGFFPTPVPPDAPPLTMDHGYGYALGILPVNTLHNIVHLLFGVLGIAAYAGMFSARGSACRQPAPCIRRHSGRYFIALNAFRISSRSACRKIDSPARGRSASLYNALSVRTRSVIVYGDCSLYGRNRLRARSARSTPS